MAQLYKMTLYVCDLVDSVDLNSIKTLIKQDALDSVSVNCICHFANEQIGAEVEWDDDIDLNRCNPPTSTWDKYFKPKTNADRIRGMTDEELYEWAKKQIGCGFDSFPCGVVCDGKCESYDDETCRAKILKWLKQPAED